MIFLGWRLLAVPQMLDGIHHVISIGGWLQEMTAVSAREGAFVRLV